jgi:hypothetical protein
MHRGIGHNDWGDPGNSGNRRQTDAASIKSTAILPRRALRSWFMDFRLLRKAFVGAKFDDPSIDAWIQKVSRISSSYYQLSQVTVSFTLP